MRNKRETIAGVAGILLAAALLTYGNIFMECLFRALGF